MLFIGPLLWTLAVKTRHAPAVVSRGEAWQAKRRGGVGEEEGIKDPGEMDDEGQSSSVLFQLYSVLQSVAMAFSALLSAVALATVASGKLTSFSLSDCAIY